MIEQIVKINWQNLHSGQRTLNSVSYHSVNLSIVDHKITSEIDNRKTLNVKTH